MHRIFLFLLMLQVPFLGLAQANRNAQKNTQVKKETPLQKLKNGALLVRLSNKENQTEALQKMGKTEAAAKIRSAQEKKNQNLVLAFRKKYRFSPVYFFYSNQSPHILDGNLSRVVFLNDNLQPDSTINFSGNNYLTAEISIVEQEEAKLSKAEKRRGVKYHDGSVSTFEVLILKDEKFEQMKDPYLIYVRTWDSLFLRRKTDAIVGIFANKIVKQHDPKTYFRNLSDIN